MNEDFIMTMNHSHEHREPSPSGKVYLVGAGPGDPELITVKGLKLLQRADVVIYDYLVHMALLEETSVDTEKIYVGKTAGQHTLRQQEINQLLVRHAREGKTVVRLKGGDPFVFGRGGEEAAMLVKHGIPWEVVPGITSAIAVPAYAGIPVTHRDYAASFTVITGHETPNKDEISVDWEALARLHGTLLILMGVGNLPMITQQLIHYGRAASTPVAVIRWGCTEMQQTVTGTLATIVEEVQQARMKSPAVIVIGEVAQLHQTLQWFSLE